MFSNYLKILLRTISKHKFFYLIPKFGLGIPEPGSCASKTAIPKYNLGIRKQH